LPQWLDEGKADVAEIFGFAAGCFFLSAVALLFLVEPADRVELPPQSMLAQLGNVLAPLRYDRNFRRSMYVAAMYGTSMSLFPHYQYVGLNVVKLDLTELLWWLIMQNVGMAVFSFIAGPLADRFGNRLVLQLSMLGLCAAPIATVVLGAYGTAAGRWFDIVFVLVGLTPVTYRTVQNYTLEICKTEDQSRYLSAVGLGMASTLILSPLLGWVMGVFGYEIVFHLVTLMIASGWLMTLWLKEPRSQA
jgi:MFS family permease